MSDCRFLPERFDHSEASDWVTDRAVASGWNDDEAERLARCVTESAIAVSERAYQLREQGPVFIFLDVNEDEATLELHHEGAIGDRPCDCAAAKAAVERRSTVWLDGQLRVHRLRITRA